MTDYTVLVGDLLATRVGEEMALDDAHLNPKLGRIVRTFGRRPPAVAWRA